DDHLTTRGTRPLVLLGATSLTVSATGILDVASHTSQTLAPAGALTGPCNASVLPRDDTGTAGAGGGPGGTLVYRGGAGGKGFAVIGGTSASSVGKPPVIRGGCGGIAGGSTMSGVGGFG